MAGADDNETRLRERQMRGKTPGEEAARQEARSERVDAPGPSGRAGGPVENVDRDAPPAPAEANPLGKPTAYDRREREP